MIESARTWTPLFHRIRRPADETYRGESIYFLQPGHRTSAEPGPVQATTQDNSKTRDGNGRSEIMNLARPSWAFAIWKLVHQLPTQ